LYLALLLLCVVRVESIEPNTTSWGSGTCVASTDVSLVLTANHVIQDGHEFKINGKKATLVGRDKVWDLAALTVDERLQTVSIATRRPRAGDKLRVCGYGSGDYKESTGKLIRYFSPTGNYSEDFLAMDAGARPGDSGGPIFDAEDNLAGVLFGSDKLGAHGSCCTRVRSFVKGLDIDPKLKEQALRVSYVIYGR